MHVPNVVCYLGIGLEGDELLMRWWRGECAVAGGWRCISCGCLAFVRVTVQESQQNEER